MSTYSMVIYFLWPSEPNQNIQDMSPYHWPILNSRTFCKTVEIPKRRTNSKVWLKVPRSAETVVPIYLDKTS